MKSTKLIIPSLVLLMGLSGCAPTTYQRSYVEYGTTYGGSAYYAVPVDTYYQTTPVIHYEQTYINSHHHDDHQHGRKAYRGNRDSQARRENGSNSAWRSRNDFFGNSVGKGESGRRGSINENRRENRDSRSQENAVARVSRQAFYPAPRSHREDRNQSSDSGGDDVGSQRRRRERP